MKRFLVFFGIIVLIFVLSVPSFAVDLRGGGDVGGEISFCLGGDSWGEAIELSENTNLIVKQTGGYIQFGIGTLSSYTTYQSFVYVSGESYFIDLWNDTNNSSITGTVPITSGFSRAFSLSSSVFYVLYITTTASISSSTYTISFNSNGGSSVPSLTSQTIIPYDIQNVSISKPNYTFAGWYTNSSLTTLAVGGTSLTGNITLYAKWNPIQLYSITYHDDEYSWIDDSGVSVLDSATLSPSLASYHDSTQYAFDGWYYDSGLTQIASVGDTLSGNIHLYAKLVPAGTQYANCSIYFNGTLQNTQSLAIPFTITARYTSAAHQFSVGHAAGTYSFSFAPDTQYFLEVIEAGTNVVYVNRFELDNATNYSYTVNSGSNIRILITTTDHSSPSAPICEITFNSNRGNAVSPVQTVDGRLPSLPICVRYGFRFDGWYYDSALTQPAHSGDDVTADIVLYAKWTFTGDPEELTADPGNVLRGMFTGLTESGLSVFLTVGNHIGFGGITIISVLVSAGVILVIYFIIKFVRE